MKVKELFEVAVKRAGLTYTDDELGALAADRAARYAKMDTGIATALKTHCKNNLNEMVKRKVVLYRGFETEKSMATSSGGSWIEMSTRTKPRSSATSSNLFINFVHHSPLWKDIPDRALSNSCTSSLSTAGDFGTLWVIIPFDDATKFGACEEDFNTTIPKTFGRNLAETAWDFAPIFNFANHIKKRDAFGELDPKVAKILSNSVFTKSNSSSQYSMEDLETISNGINTLMSIVLKSSGKNASAHHDELYFTMTKISQILRGKTFLEWLETVVSPESLGVSVVTLSGINKFRNEPEFWFQSGYVAFNTKFGKDMNRPYETEWFKRVLAQVNS